MYLLYHNIQYGVHGYLDHNTMQKNVLLGFSIKRVSFGISVANVNC